MRESLYIPFVSRRRLQQRDTVDVTLAGNTLTSITGVKYVVLELDQYFKGDQITDKLVEPTHYTMDRYVPARCPW